MNNSIFSNIVALNKVLPSQGSNDIYQCPNQSFIEQSKWIIYGNSLAGRKMLNVLKEYSNFANANRVMDIDLRIPLISFAERDYLSSVIGQMVKIFPDSQGLIISHPRIFHQIDFCPNIKCVTFGFNQDTLQTLVSHQDLWSSEEALYLRQEGYSNRIFYHWNMNPFKCIYIYGDDMDSILYAAYAWHLQVKEHHQAPKIIVLNNSHFLYDRMDIAEHVLSALCPQADLDIWHQASISELIKSYGADALFIAPQHRALYVRERLKESDISLYVIKENMRDKLYRPSTDVKSMLFYLNKSVDLLPVGGGHQALCSAWANNYALVGEYTKRDMVEIMSAAQQEAMDRIKAEGFKINQIFS